MSATARPSSFANLKSYIENRNMKRTYIQPSIVVVEVELSNLVCASNVGIKINSEEPTDYLDAPRTRLWGNED